MTARTTTWANVLEAADYELRHRNVIEANRHLRAMTPQRRAELEAEWEAPVSDGRRTGPKAF
ncbi:MAG: hypothetical protein WCL10_18900 [Novosphingobium sp.]|uniref:hypothetical protein n=1 Tax=Novosphingobium sp. TaxID=1874826 RepID=UPI003017F559